MWEYLEDRDKYRLQPREWGDVRAKSLEGLYAAQISTCPYCAIVMKTIHRSKNHWNADNNRGEENIAFYYCLECGYWSVEQEWNNECTYGYYGEDYERICHNRATLKEFDLQRHVIPTETLKREVTKNPKLMYQISPKKMEDLIQQVFKDFYRCDVEHCGKSHDGGVDLFVLDADKPILVQVKRRENPNAVEPVSLIRDLLGAMFINNSKRGVFVSTADKFSFPSHKLRNELLTKGKLDYFELINFSRLSEILALTGKNQSQPWLSVFNELHKETYIHEIHLEQYF
jgi:hypothetical protein